jgi:P27 family predicted phage terminase small subunit
MARRGPVPKANKLAGMTRTPIAVGAPDRPAWLLGEAAAEWNRVVPELMQSGTLASADRAALAAYCRAWADVVELTAVVEKEGRVTREPIQTREGEVLGERVRPHPAVRQLEAASLRMRQYLIEFGLSPAARARMGADVAKAVVPKTQSKLGEIKGRIDKARKVGGRGNR